MTPLPKNKITRAERGKRRRGNTPKLVKVGAARAKVPLHKEKMVQKLRLILNPVKKLSETEAKSQLAAKMSTKRPKKLALSKKKDSGTPVTQTKSTSKQK